MLFRRRQPETLPLSFFNTLTEKTEAFSPIRPGAVTMYSCGPTVYDHVHIGNLRSFVLADTIKRTLIAYGLRVQHTINLTDFGHLSGDGDDGEDKMVLALKKAKKPMTLDAMNDIAEIYTASFKKDMESINNLPPTTYAPASKYVDKEIALIKTLVEKGYTYEISDGVYFDIARFPQYGKLGNIDLEKLKSGARVEVNPEKRHPADFVVWKKSELGWKSPWGYGFPGWHIECTAMVFATLGKQIDIHTGGEDLKYTHHNGEIAQAEAATKKVPYVRYWMHNAFITIDNTKVAKSLGNGIRLEQLRERGYSPLVYRYWLLGGHYRSPMNFTFEGLDSAKQAYLRLKRHLLEDYKAKAGGTVVENYWKEFLSALNDDLNTPKALAVLWKLVEDNSVSAEDKVATLKKFDTVLGLGLDESLEATAKTLGVVKMEELPEEVKQLVEERESARKEKNWDEADRLREAINMKGYLVEDKPEGPRITKA